MAAYYKYTGRMFPVSKLRRDEMGELERRVEEIAAGFQASYDADIDLMTRRDKAHMKRIDELTTTLAAAAAEHAAALAQVAELEQGQTNLYIYIEQLEAQLEERDAQAAVSEVSIHNLKVRVTELEASLAESSEWRPVNPVGMARGDYDDAEIKLCYRRVQREEDHEPK